MARVENEYNDDIEDLDYDFDHGENYTAPQTNWPTDSGITEAAAESACNQSVQESPVYSQCQSSISSDSITTLITACKTDIQVKRSFKKKSLKKNAKQ